MNRILVLFAVLVLIASFAGVSSAQDVVRTSNPLERGLGEDDFPRVQKIARNVYTYEALTGRPDDRYTTNTMFVVTDDGVLVADGQGNPDATRLLVEAIGEITDKPITHVVICSDHGDHTNGNVSFPKTAQFLAHPNSKATLERSLNNPNRNADSPPVIMPTALVEDRRVLELGGMEIQILFFGRAHTGGDLFVYLPEEKILFTTEVFLNRLFSGYRSSYPSEWLEVMDRAEELDVDVYLPGHGFIDDAKILEEEWEEYKRHMAVVLAEVKRLHAAGLSVEEAIEEADFGDYASWSGAGSQGPGGIRRIYAELNGELP
jgi:glyoxylase-like metal-dependent hydrolase (beta-lactamase superfamily II)